jgi:hypothetical protein
MRASGQSQVSQIQTKRKMKQCPSGLDLLVEQTTPMKHWPVYIHFPFPMQSDTFSSGRKARWLKLSEGLQRRRKSFAR